MKIAELKTSIRNPCAALSISPFSGDQAAAGA
jgi:hypothetical protein